VARQRGFAVVQICNPPDLLFLIALPWKLLGKKIVFDHHDLCPELFADKFGNNKILNAIMRGLEYITFKVADLVISTNDTFRGIALERGGKRPQDVITVYSIPPTAMMHRVEPQKELRAKARCIIGYLGIIGDQDGVDHLVKMVHHLVRNGAFNDCHAVVIGDGPALKSVKELAVALDLSTHITFTGYLSGHELLECLSTFDIGIIPDPPSDYNDKISMNKVFEYSALGIPSVAYPLSETSRLLGKAGVYSTDNNVAGLASACLTLISNAEERRQRGAWAKELADTRFNWASEAKKYVAAYDSLVAQAR
jgi:glycosyltransferase involved in cell wall biosynthesis